MTGRFIASCLLPWLLPGLMATVAVADAGPVTTGLTDPGDQTAGQAFVVTAHAELPGGRGIWRTGGETHPIVTPYWEIQGRFVLEGPVEAMGEVHTARRGDRFEFRQTFRCTGAGDARIDIDGTIAYEVRPTPNAVLHLGDIPIDQAPVRFRCRAAGAGSGTDTGAGSGTGTGTGTGANGGAPMVGRCDPRVLETDYGTFVGQIRREPGDDPMQVGDRFTIHTVVRNLQRGEAYAGASFNLSGDLWSWFGNGVTPRHANDGHHPWLYVGSPEHPYRDQATFTCARPDTVGIMHLMKIRWPDPDDVTAPMHEATLTCYVHPFKCAGREGE